MNRWQTAVEYSRRTSAWRLRNKARRGRAIWSRILLVFLIEDEGMCRLGKGTRGDNQMVSTS